MLTVGGSAVWLQPGSSTVTPAPAAVVKYQFSTDWIPLPEPNTPITLGLVFIDVLEKMNSS